METGLLSGLLKGKKASSYLAGQLWHPHGDLLKNFPLFHLHESKCWSLVIKQSTVEALRQIYLW